MNEESVRKFEVTPSQYQLFRFKVARPTVMNVQLIATTPVNLVLLNDSEKTEYEKGNSATHTYTAAWGRRSDLEATVKVDPGTWYLVVEGGEESSRGRVMVGFAS